MADPARVALVTGGAVRVGRAIVESLAAAGWVVHFTFKSSRDEAIALETQIRERGQRATAVPMNVDEAGERRRAVEEVSQHAGRLDALVNNAAVFPRTPPTALSESALEATLRTNLVGPVMLALGCADMLRESSGSVVNIVDIYGLTPLRDHLAYSIAKAGLVMATKALAAELAPAVRVNAVAPGIALFPDDYDESTRQALLARTLLKRAGGGGEIAAAVRYLLEGTAFMTGQTLVLDGGRTVAL